MAIFQVSKKNKEKNRNIKAISGWILLFLSTFVFLFSVTKLLPFLQYFLLGVFGAFVYPLSVVGFIVALALLNNKKYVMPKKYAICLGLSLFFLLTIIQLIVVGSPNQTIQDRAITYGEYIGLNYTKQFTAGGMLVGFLPTTMAFFMGLPATYVVLSVAFLVCIAFFIEAKLSIKKTEEQNSPIKLQIKEKEKSSAPINPRKIVKEEKSLRLQVDEENQSSKQDVMFAGNKQEEEKKELSAREKLGLVGGYKQQVGQTFTNSKLELPDEPEAKNRIPEHMSMREYLLSPPQVDLKEFNNQQSRMRSIAEASGRIKPSVEQNNNYFAFSNPKQSELNEQNSAYQTYLENQKRLERKRQENAVVNASLNEINTNISQLKQEEIQEEVTAEIQEEPIGNLTEIAPEEITNEAEDIIRSVVEQEKLERQTEITEEVSTETKDSEYISFDDIEPQETLAQTEPTIEETISPEQPNKPTEFSRDSFAREQRSFGDRGFDRDNPLSRENNSRQDLSMSRENNPQPNTSFDRSMRPIDEKERRKRFVSLDEDQTKKEEKIKPYKYSRPSLDLLTTQSDDLSIFADEVPQKRVALENALENFGIPAKVQNVVIGPTVTRYEIEMPEGISVKRILSLDADIAYALSAKGQIRIEAPIPGRSIVGIEVPNSKVAKVSIKDVLQSKEFSLSPSPLTFALGKDITGNVKVCNLAKMPHLLVAGTTGSGKSVCVNTLITSILYKSSPDDVKFIMIDPKQVELSMYEGLPHLVVPRVITDPNKAVNALQWAVDEMERRFRLISEERVRNIDEYNKTEKVLQNKAKKIPYLVIIFDEFADFMMVAKNEIDDKIKRITAKARAAGICLVLATQRPSTDVVTGIIKANIPSRIAFRVAGRVDSEVILGSTGAEKLLGYGDMLYKPSDSASVRIQGCLIETEETKEVVKYIIENNEEIFDEEAFNAINNPGKGNNSGDNDGNNGVDPLLPRALKICIDNGVASTTMVQRKLSIGYPRAARIVDQMEERGYIASADGSKQRAVYLSIEEFYATFGDIYD